MAGVVVRICSWGGLEEGRGAGLVATGGWGSGWNREKWVRKRIETGMITEELGQGLGRKRCPR